MHYFIVESNLKSREYSLPRMAREVVRVSSFENESFTYDFKFIPHKNEIELYDLTPPGEVLKIYYKPAQSETGIHL